MTVWISKYAVTKGIFKVEGARVCTTVSKTMIEMPKKEQTHLTHFMHKPHWHSTEKEAKDQGKKMIHKKLKSIEKQQSNLMSLLKELNQ